MKGSPLQGVSGVLRNLNRELKKMETNTKAGLTEACLVVKADSVKKTPIDLGNLRNSAFIMVTDAPPDISHPAFTGEDTSELNSVHEISIAEAKKIVKGGNGKLIGIIGYTAFYSVYVHEMPDSNNFNSGTNKFLQKALLQNKSRIKRIIIKHTRI